MSRDASPRGPDEGRWVGLVSKLAPEVLDQVIEESRAEAAAILRGGLTEALVEAVASLMASRPGVDGPREPVGQVGPVDETEPLHESEPVDEPEPVDVPEPVHEAGPDAGGNRTAAGWYVYGVAWSSAPLPRFPGVDGGRMESVVVDDLAAVVSPVEGGPSWGVGPDGEIDLEALAPRAQQHERVLEKMLDTGAILPFRFGVMYPDLTEVVRFLRDDAGALRSALRRLEGMEEWGLAIEWQRLPSERKGSPTPGVPAGGPGTGQEYLVRRLQQQAVDQDSRRRARSAAQSIHQELAGIASGSVVHATSSSGGERGQRRSRLLTASYLLPRHRVGEFRSAAEQALAAADADLGVSGDLTGPWPPYNFAELVEEPVE